MYLVQVQLRQKYYAPQVWSNRGLNSWPPDHGQYISWDTSLNNSAIRDLNKKLCSVWQVLRVSATDPDGDDLFYELIEEEEGNTEAAEYFFLEEETGVLMLKKLLTDGAQESFSVSSMIW